MSTSAHKPAANQFDLYAFQEIEENEDEQEDYEMEGEMEWSDEEDLQSYDDDEFEDDFDDDDEDDEFDDDDFDSETETEDDDHEYVNDEDSHYRNNNNCTSAGPGYFYPEQPYVGPPIVPKPSPEASSSKLRYYVLSPICDIATIYIKFAILAILIYACALWYTVYYGDLSSITDMDDVDADTCPAN